MLSNLVRTEPVKKELGGRQKTKQTRRTWKRERSPREKRTGKKKKKRRKKRKKEEAATRRERSHKKREKGENDIKEEQVEKGLRTSPHESAQN